MPVFKQELGQDAALLLIKAIIMAQKEILVERVHVPIQQTLTLSWKKAIHV